VSFDGERFYANWHAAADDKIGRPRTTHIRRWSPFSANREVAEPQAPTLRLMDPEGPTIENNRL
jgi:hypothetical protein